jgi:glucokinase
MADYAIGVDLGGTNLRAAAITAAGEMLEKTSLSTDLKQGPAEVVADIVAAITKLKSKFATHTLAGVGIGVPGFIDIKRGFIVGSNNLPGFDQFPARDEIEKLLGTTVILENDANAAAMGEKWMGAGRDVSDLVLLTLGTGIGGGIIADGRILHGFVGMAGELGHITVFPDGNPCGCGNYGCLEKHASATAIVSMARLLSLGDHLTAEDVYRLSVNGNERAQMIFHTVGTALGIALASLMNIFNFPLYLLSGGVLAGWDQFAPAMMAEMEKRSFGYRNTKFPSIGRTEVMRVGKAKLGNVAGLYGAAHLPLQTRR